MGWTKIFEIIDKADLANVASFTVVISILAYSLYKGDAELIATILGAGIAWLFKGSNG